jgi:diguanylate cyclase (GGDEF)-like protein
VRFGHGLQARILALALGLLLAVLAVALVTVGRATGRHARARVADELAVGAAMFRDKLASRQQALWDAAETLAKDGDLRQAIFADEGDGESLFVALNNHRVRTGADLAMLLELDGGVRVDTRDPRARGRRFAGAGALHADVAPHREPRLAVLDGALYQLSVVPYYVPVSAPRAAFWLLLGQAVDDGLARSLGELAGLEVAFLAAGPDGPRVLVSSLPVAERRALAAAARSPRWDGSLELPGDRLLGERVVLPGSDGTPFTAVLLRSSAQAFLDFRALAGEVVWIVLGFALLATGGAVVIARGITRPVRALESAARSLAGGAYSADLPVNERGEIGELAREFARMQEGIREREAAIHHLAFHDDLSGLPNRNRFRLEVGEAIAAATRARGRLAVAVIDLDRFKDINDTLGHHVGDRLLLELATRLQAAGEERGLVVARLGGDEFGVLLPSLAIRQTADAVAALRRVLCAAFQAEEVYVEVEASIGIALHPEHGPDPATLLKHAEVAMYYAKERRQGIAFYDSAQDRHSVQRLSLMGELRRALETDELRLAFQPKVELRSGRIAGCEALVRWQHPRLGTVEPGEFVPIAEQTGAIRHLTRWVLEHALAQLAEWEGAALELGVAVNISALDLHDRQLPRRLEESLARHGVPAARLVLEVTESAMMADAELARRVLEEVAGLGVTVSVDDFGTGYSSLAQLKRLPVHELKVDRSFVMELERESDVARIVLAAIEMGHALGMRVVAEGVETRATLDRLREMGCDLAQGYYLGQPMSAGELARRVRGATAEPSPALQP